ncbi:MAG: M36 family metallopeptidase [Candidatus Riflebacteria bacterium]|nr:M36 family metallopeptidase [Candidatus Riflebacteria bacterium]
MNRAAPVLAGLLLLIAAGGSSGFDRDPAASLERDVRATGVFSLAGYERLRSIFEAVDPKFQIAWNGSTGTPSAVACELLGAKADGLLARLSRGLARGVTLEPLGAGASRRDYRQRLGDRPIFPGSVAMTASPERFFVAGSLVLDSRVLNRSGLASGEAAGKALAHLGLARSAKILESEDVFFDTGAGLRHGRRLRVGSWTPPGDWTVVVDAEDGRVLFCANLARAVEGTGSVFAVNPLRAKLSQEKLLHLVRSGRLEGEYVTVENEDTMEATAHDNRFVYDETSKHLDEVMAYFHVDRIHDFFKERFGFTALDSPMAVGVYYGDRLDNAYYMPWANCIVLGDGDRYNVLSRDATVIWHEYTHAVTYALARFGVGGEAAALGEGYSDYFAASYAGDPRIGDWVVAKLGRPHLRTVENTKRYPEDLVHESHQDSLIWSGSLWDLRKAVGTESADALAFHAVGYLGSDASFAAAVQAVLQADAERFAGAHRVAILEAFGKHGLVQNDAQVRQALRRRALFERLGGSQER